MGAPGHVALDVCAPGSDCTGGRGQPGPGPGSSGGADAAAGPLAQHHTQLQRARSRQRAAPAAAPPAACAAAADAGGGGGGGAWRGLQQEVDGLAGHAAAAAAQRAARAWRAEHAALLARLGELEAQAGSQEQELLRLRPLLPPADAAPGGGAAVAAAALGRELQAQRAEAGAWRGRFQLEQRLRLLSEGAMGDLLGVLDELSLQCDAISGKLAAAGAAAAADKGRGARQRRRGGAAGDSRAWSIALEAARALCLVACAIGVTIVVTRQVLLTGGDGAAGTG
ncbi:MAG: hypothetical protein J3K34DRAFT_390962 [Monoraphidium minutum]|nr:MAG: hypothetical protein J3K34DRAFT_390962 [Monoraphidium minutum]